MELLGEKLRERVPSYTHTDTAEQARVLVDKGYSALKFSYIGTAAYTIETVRKEVGDDVNIMVDLHGPPWMTVPDAIAMGKVLEDYGILFYEDPVAPGISRRSPR